MKFRENVNTKEEVKKDLQIKRGEGAEWRGAHSGEVCMTKRPHNGAALWCGAKGGAAQKKMNALWGKFDQEYYVT